MDLEFSQEDFDFQQEVRAWIEEKYPQEMRQRRSRSPGGSLSKEDYVYWQQALHENGWSGVNWPKEHGGPCWQFTYSVGRLMDDGGGQMEASLVKLLACKLSEWTSREAMQIHGGMGYAQETDASRYWLDARVLSIFEGTEETLALKVVGRSLVEQASA